MPGPNRPTYTAHARRRMAERKVTEREVEIVLVHHHARRRDAKGNEVLLGRVRGRRIKVVVARGSSPPHVITVGD